MCPEIDLPGADESNETEVERVADILFYHQAAVHTTFKNRHAPTAASPALALENVRHPSPSKLWTVIAPGLDDFAMEDLHVMDKVFVTFLNCSFVLKQRILVIPCQSSPR